MQRKTILYISIIPILVFIISLYYIISIYSAPIVYGMKYTVEDNYDKGATIESTQKISYVFYDFNIVQFEYWADDTETHSKYKSGDYYIQANSIKCDFSIPSSASTSNSLLENKSFSIGIKDRFHIYSGYFDSNYYPVIISYTCHGGIAIATVSIIFNVLSAILLILAVIYYIWQNKKSHPN